MIGRARARANAYAKRSAGGGGGGGGGDRSGRGRGLLADEDDYSGPYSESGGGSDGLSPSPGGRSPPERPEERVMDECPFFYTDFGGPGADRGRRGGRGRRRGRGRDSRGGDGGGGGGRGSGSSLGARGLGFDGADVPGGGGGTASAGRYLPDPRVGDAFRARHEYLNAGPPLTDVRLGRGGPSPPPSEGGDADGRPGTGGPPDPPLSLTRSGVHRATLARSSLYYLRSESGKVQIRMPNDNVRLLMDPNLEPGILSVEYGGDGSDRGGGNGTDDADADADADTDRGADPAKRTGELNYVLTVDDDLYRRLVKEISDSLRTPCGLYYCCQESETSRVNIGVAMFLLGIVYIFLFVAMLIWPVD